MQGEALECAMRLHTSFCVPALQAYQSQEVFDPDAPEIDPEVSVDNMRSGVVLGPGAPEIDPEVGSRV
jgi:hypothetical protein